MRIALVVYPGVIADECDAFRSVLSELRETEVVSVGATVGICHGQGGVQHVDVVFDAVELDGVVAVEGNKAGARVFVARLSNAADIAQRFGAGA